jgi:Beta-lactamase class C and other penicillin binding proteins
MKFSEKTNKLIKSTIKGRKHIKFTVGVLCENEMTFKLFDANGEIPYESYYYEIGSITKVFTTSLFAKYLQSGEMNLADSITKYIPELEDNRYYPTLKRLATHTAGYPTRYPISKSEIFTIFRKQLMQKQMTIRDYLKLDYEKMIRLTSEKKLQDKDYKWQYANFGTSLLGVAISNAAGTSFWDDMTVFLTQDLGLKESFLGTNLPEILTGYDLKNRAVGNWGWHKEDLLAPAGCITSTAADLLKFAKLNIEQCPSYLGLCHKLYAKAKYSNMGLGWWIDEKNPNICYHGGNTDGFASMLAFDKKKKTAVVLLANIYYYAEREKLFADILENL